MQTLYFVYILIIVALIFDFFNGFHDAANSVATVVTTRVLSPLQAILWAAFFNFVAAFVFGTGLAKTISEKLIDPKAVDVYVICGGLIGAIVWDVITWLMALPTSSSHANHQWLRWSRHRSRWVQCHSHQRLDSCHRLPRHLSSRGPHLRLAHYDRHQLAHPSLRAIQRREPLPPSSACLRRSLLPGSRHQRRPEDNGHHRRPPRRRGSRTVGQSQPSGLSGALRKARDCLVDHPQLSRRYGHRNHGRRMAHRPDRRLSHHSPPPASWRLLRGARRRHLHRLSHTGQGPHFYDACDRRSR